MKDYSKIIYVCTANTYLSPVAETMYRQFTEQERERERAEGESQHDLRPCSHENSVPLEQFDIVEDALVLTMTFSEKVAYLEKYQGGEVYTLGEFVGEDTDITDPYGGEEEQYDLCYHEIARRIRKVIQILIEDENEKGGQAE